MNKKKFLLFLTWGLLGLLLLNVIRIVWLTQEQFFTFDYWQRYPELKETYRNSQYVNSKVQANQWVPDHVVFSYAGGALIQGINPVLVIPDAPPLGKYIIGLSAVLFNNENIIIVLVFGLLDLLLLYKIGNNIFKSRILALLPPLLFSLEPIFLNQFLTVPLFDHAQLFFLLLSLLLFNKGVLGKKHPFLFFSLSSLCLGIFISIKFFASGLTIIAAALSVLILHKLWKKGGWYFLSLPIAAGVLLASYAWVFTYGYTFKEFLGIQKWVFIYHTGQNILPFTVWPLLLFNKWYTWWNGNAIISDPQWVISWPIITVLSLVTIVLYIFKKIERRKELEIFMAWMIFYLLFLSTGHVFSRYFLILLPIMYLISLYGVVNVARQYILKDKKKK